jgi:hypothetical protein
MLFIWSYAASTGMTFRKPCGSSQSSIHRLHGSRKRQMEREVYGGSRGTVFTHSPSLWNQPKRYSVLKVLSFYSSKGSEKWKRQDYLRTAIFSSPWLQA